MHLGSLADHPDAALYPKRSADALAHAAQAEIKLRHPERAIELYESALKLRGNHRPTLRALAELALERGEKQQAANYLRRIAEDSSDRMERAQMFERLGDLCLELNDEAAGAGGVREAVKAYNVRARSRCRCSRRY
jgi:tetratricopeptide (TPR) repeat protein